MILVELPGYGYQAGENLVERARLTTSQVSGIIVTDSKGAYDACTHSEASLLGLSNARAAVQAYAVRQSLRDQKILLHWVTSDWNLSDALTKAPAECRDGLCRYLQTGRWKLKWHQDFVVSAKKADRTALQELEDEEPLESISTSMPEGGGQQPSVDQVCHQMNMPKTKKKMIPMSFVGPV